jgi:predicted dehydrogenase
MRIGLLGAARIAPPAVIAPAARAGDTIVAVAARDPERARAFAAEHGIPHVALDYQALIARDDLDLIYVGLPISAHAPWTIRAAERGHAVLCEKPFATSVVEAQAMVAAGQAGGRPVLEAFHYRHHPLFHALLALVRDDAIGPLAQAEASFDAEIPRADAVRWSRALGGGALMDLGCYPLHALRTLLGEPEVLTAEAEFVDGVDAALQGELRFPGGVEGRITCAMNAGRRAATVRLVGERGEIRVENFVAPHMGHQLVVRDAAGERTLTVEGRTTFDHQLDHVRAVLAGDAAPLTGGEDAIAQMAAIDTLYRVAGRP